MIGRALGRALALCCAVTLFGAAPAPPDIAYRVTPEVTTATGIALRVELSLRGDPSGVTRLRLPDRYGGERELWRNLDEITAQDGVLERTGPALLTVRHRRGARLTLNYRVRSGRRPGSERLGLDYRPDLSTEGFQALGETVFAWPAGQLTSPARFSFGPPPPGWVVGSDAEHLDAARLDAPAGKVADVLESVLIGGPNVRIVQTQVDGASLRLALRGRFSFADAALANRVARVLAAERAFWGDGGGAAFVSIDALAARGPVQARAGVGRGDGAALYASSTVPLDRLSDIVAHELAHGWIPRRLGGLPRGEAEVGAYWFSEGFADALAYAALLKSGVWTLTDYAEALTRGTPTVGGRQSPITNAHLVQRYWREPALFHVPYDRGLMLATLWDDRLRRSSGGRLDLGAVLKAQHAAAAAGRSGPADALFISTYETLSGQSLAADLARYVDRGEPVILPSRLYDGCLIVELTPAVGTERAQRVRPPPGQTPEQARACSRSIPYS